ncbi:MAG: hypothetical protein SGCHY_002029 [Lobulomycetales sp.]
MNSTIFAAINTTSYVDSAISEAVADALTAAAEEHGALRALDSLVQMFSTVFVAFIVHVCFKVKEANFKPVNMLLILSSFSWLMNAVLSYASFSTNPTHLAALLVSTMFFDVGSKLLVLAFLYKKFEIVEKSNSSISKTALAKALRRIPFVLSALYLVASGVIASWMFAEGLLFEITDPKYIVLTSAELALVILDIYVVLQLYVLKRGNPDSQVILFRIAFVIGISALMKAATVVLFWLDLDPFWSLRVLEGPLVGVGDQAMLTAAAPKPERRNEPKPDLINCTIKRRWHIIRQLGKGAFGEVYECLDLQTTSLSTRFAIKIEGPTVKKKVLKQEVAVMRRLQGMFACLLLLFGRFIITDCTYLPTLIASGRFTTEDSNNTSSDSTYAFMIMQLLDCNLSELRKSRPEGRFSVETTAMLGMQMIRAIESVHSSGIIHRDIKPGNFCLGQPASTKSSLSSSLPDSAYASADSIATSVKVYLIDFGLTRRNLMPDQSIRPARSKIGFRGTARYASLAAHDGRDLGTKDDLWSLLYLLIEFIVGTLPWRGKQRDIIGCLKRDCSISPEEICSVVINEDGSRPLLDIWRYLDSLGYDSVPDYDLIYKLIRDIAGKGDGFSPGSMLYDWQLDVAQEEDPCTQPVIELQENQPAELEEDCVMPDAEESVDAMEAGNTEGPPAKFIKTLASRSIKGRTRSAVASLRALKPFLNAGGRKSPSVGSSSGTIEDRDDAIVEKAGCAHALKPKPPSSRPPGFNLRSRRYKFL